MWLFVLQTLSISIRCLVLLALFAAMPGHAATLTDNEGCDVLLQGTIELGDAERLAKRLGDIGYGFICFNSMGGSYIEGVKIANLLRENARKTLIRRGEKCLSACAIAFMGGSSREDEHVRPDRTIVVGAQLGFHAPYLVVPGGVYNEAIVQKAYDDALVGIASLSAIMNQIFFSPQLLSKMLRKGPSEYYLIDTVGKAVVEKITIAGYRKVSPVDDKAALAACDNMFNQLWYERGEGEFSLADYVIPGIHSSTKAGTVTYDVGAYPPEATASCLLTGHSLGWSIVFRSPTGYKRSSSEHMFDLGLGGLLEVEPYFFYPGSTMIASIEEEATAKQLASSEPSSKTLRFERYSNSAMSGIDIVRLSQVGEERCQIACTEKVDCHGYTYDKWNKWCFMKRDIDIAYLDPKYVSGVRSEIKQPRKSSAPLGMESYKSKRFRYSGSLTPASNTKDCERQCMGSGSCVAFSFSRSRRTCLLMDNVLEYFSDRDYDSGVKRQRVE